MSHLPTINSINQPKIGDSLFETVSESRRDEVILFGQMVLGIIELFRKEDTSIVPFFIPVGIIGLIRLVLFLFRFVCYLLYKPQIPSSKRLNTFSSSDVTIIVPTIDCGPEFASAAAQWVKNSPAEIIVVTTDACFPQIQAMVYNFDQGSGLFRVLSVPEANKRVQLMEGVNASRTAILAFSDDDAIWSDDFIKWMLVPFDSPKIGGVGSSQAMTPCGDRATVWEVLADMRLSMRMMEAASTSRVDGGISCLSGRTAVYRREIMADPDLREKFVSEKWRGKYSLHSGDDKFLTRWLVSHGWEMSFQKHERALLLTTFKPNWHFLKQLLRWTRNTWRSDFTSLFIDRKIWRRYPYVAMNMLDKMLNPITLLIGPVFIIYAMVMHPRWSPYAIGASEVVWLFFSRYIRLAEHWRRKQWDIVYLPLYIVFNYFFALMKVYALCTLHITGWATRTDTSELSDIEMSAVSITIVVDDEHEGPVLCRKITPTTMNKVDLTDKYPVELKANPVKVSTAPAA
uniref:Glycosyltransferase 2-like domain-containing protein n=1 Tax=Spongospora subterranea TaxID=70186 RepID=A0A0H5QN77_9EUKA|eukprot:CRZ02816.1 hypothetical protein [Spongospora subterranea]